jgi:asparagine synthase (glutamine-hydrolysing)
MCGICGVVTANGRGLEIPLARFLAMREALAHRGPDDAGLHEGAGALLGHRRLAVIDPGEGGRQPMATPDGRFVLVYNGELYNDAEVRALLEAEGVAFRSSCDTETVLHAAARWGAEAATRLRGMYALALWDSTRRVLLLGRDGFGMKPLHWAHAGGEFVFASEAHALFEHPGLAARPDWGGIWAYAATVRTAVESRTMFEGVHAVRPGEWLSVDCSGSSCAVESRVFRASVSARGGLGSIRETIEDSARRHLRSDVPWCSLLSGGLDSTILAALVMREAGRLRTYVSGCPEAGNGAADDFAFARTAADAIGTFHDEVAVDRGGFLERWGWMVDRLGTPLSTPNEVAIFEVASRLRGDGHVVTLSGEGADELFGGYDLPIAGAIGHVRARPDANGDEDGAFALASASWLTSAQRGVFMRADFASLADRDGPLESVYAGAFRGLLDEVAAEFDGSGRGERRVQAFLRMLRRFNLTGLLGRLDTATMLASVEGRTPFADAEVAMAAERLALAVKFGEGDPPRTKIPLREGFTDLVPASIVTRPKRSFPLPFEGWLAPMAGVVRASDLVAEIYTPAAVEFVWSDPARSWNLAWPMANLALWGERWWKSSR